MKKIIFSTVLFNTPFNYVERLIESIESLNIQFKNKEINIKIEKFMIWDNSKISRFSEKQLNTKNFSFETIFTNSKNNLGYGGGHNKNLLRQEINKDIWFVALNPDVYFEGKNLIGFFEFITSKENISCAAPLIYLPDGNIQFSAKKIPTMASLLISRFEILQLIPFFRKYLNKNQNKDLNYENEFIHSPFLSGCFLAFPSHIYKDVNGFSKKYFLHFEDADIVRRCNLEGLTLHCPYGSIIHIRGRGSHKSLIQQFHLAISYINYSIIWGFRLY